MATRKTVAKRAAKKSVRGASATAKSAPADAVDEQLARYRSMRDFGVTAEPSGETKETAAGTLPFCIQKHAASHLHYDFRLGWNGVLKSWAVAKGPSYNVKDKRLAVQVEDHPMEYGGFEGIIPAGQYGGGTVMLWDQGTWEPQAGHTDIDAGLREGSLKFVMNGTKMHGKWTLIRMGGKAANERKPNWLLIKEHDGFERPPDAPCITEEAPDSVVTGRSLDQIAASEDHVWNSKETAKPGQAWYRKEAKAGVEAPKTAKSLDLPKALEVALGKLPKEHQPTFLKPQLADSAESPPDGAGWLHELKLDGYRIQARKSGAKVQMLTRTGLDWTARIPSVAAAVAALPIADVTLDGEVVVLSADGTTNFADLQASFQDGAKNPLTYFCFDLLHAGGHNPRGLPLIERKTLLAQILEPADQDYLRLSEHLETGGEAMFHKACELHAEGIVSKLASSKYTAGRTSSWLKLKCLHEQEFVVGGFTLPSLGRTGMHGVGALLLGYYRDGKLIYAGRTGTGFNQKTHKLVRDRLDALAAAKSPFATVPADARRGVEWVKPELVAQVRFATWTAENLVRQAAFLGLREDKPASEVTREDAAPTPKRNAESTRDGKIAQATHTIRPKAAAKVAEVAEATHAPIRLTHPQKLLDAESGLTKQALADYYWAVAEHMLPHIAGRPLSIVRCPEGSTKPCFYQKHVTATLPPGISAVDVPDKKTGKPEPYITLSTPEALAGLAQMGVLEVHPWGSRNADLEHPDRLIFDLDPDESLPWTTVTKAAIDVRDRLKKLGLTTFLKTTGGKGLHIVVPIEPTLDWTTAKNFAHAFVQTMEKANPALYLTKMTKAARVGKIYLDYLRNERGATAVAPFSPRARAGGPVSVPLAWSELASPERPAFRVATFSEWKSRIRKDPWKSLESTHQAITAATLASVGLRS